MAELPANLTVTLAERGKRYGDFKGHARITQNLKRAMKARTNWEKLSDSQKEALEMIAHKIGRILNGDPNYRDSWHDLAGYASLEDEILAELEEIEKANQRPAMVGKHKIPQENVYDDGEATTAQERAEQAKAVACASSEVRQAPVSCFDLERAGSNMMRGEE